MNKSTHRSGFLLPILSGVHRVNQLGHTVTCLSCVQELAHCLSSASTWLCVEPVFHSLEYKCFPTTELFYLLTESLMNLPSYSDVNRCPNFLEVWKSFGTKTEQTLRWGLITKRCWVTPLLPYLYTPAFIKTCTGLPRHPQQLLSLTIPE